MRTLSPDIVTRRNERCLFLPHLYTQGEAEGINENLVPVHLNKHEGEAAEQRLKVIHFVVLHLSVHVEMPIEQLAALANKYNESRCTPCSFFI